MKEFGRKLLNGLKSMGLYLADKAWENKTPLVLGGAVAAFARGFFCG